MVSLPKLREEGPTEISAGVATPAPERATLWGEYAALLAIESEALTEPAAEGLKVTLICTLLAGARESGRETAEREKAALSTLMELTVNVAVPLLLRVTA
jgi:hypothetical protein